MGYTHYWRQKKSFTDEQWALVCAAARLVVERFEGVLCYEYDMPTRKPLISKTMIRFNGKDEDGHETFVVHKRKRKPYTYEDKGKHKRDGAFNFCKTARKPYDGAVVQILAAIDKLVPGALTLSSDGGDEAFALRPVVDSIVRKVKGDEPEETYPEEHVIELDTGSELRCPAHPQPCTYVRIVDPMVGEVVYWDSAEWREDPEGVMGAIIGAMSSKSDD